MSTEQPAAPSNVRDQILDEEMKSSYLTYAMSVIISRALPDIRDGLKPSQRRILVAMNDLNLTPRAKFRKCSKIAGDTTGNYHPHGDQVVYPTLVRLAQDFNMRYPLVDKQGNFGAIDGSPPAAMRYTEARMAQPSTDMMDDLDKDTVAFVRNYDDTRDEPTVLPGRFPNLVCNGSQGIAVGMATSIPPHNLNEVVDALIALINNPEITLAQVLAIIPGPDFPTGGIILGHAGINQAYVSGRGNIVVRARATIETDDKGRESIVVTELPYQVNPTVIFDKVKDLLAEKVIDGLDYVNDETDREGGLRLVFELKKGFQADVILNQLYRYTALQSTFSINLLALSGGRPRTLSIKDMLVGYRDHRINVIQRRTRYLKRKAEERLHIVEGLLIAIADINEVVRIIRSSSSPPAARTGLIQHFVLSERQADAILAMRLARLTGLEVDKLQAEKIELLSSIARYNEILGDVREVHKLIIADLVALKASAGDARRTEISSQEGEIEDESLIPTGQMLVTFSHEGYVKRMSPEIYRQQGRGGVGVIGADTADGDFIERMILADNHDYFMVFTSFGQVHWLKCWRIKECVREARGTYIGNLIPLRDEGGAGGRGKEQVASVLPVREFDGRQLVTISRNGIIKKTALEEYSNPRAGGIIGAGLQDGDRLVRAVLTSGNNELLVSTSQGQTIRFSEAEVRPMGRSATGVIAVRFKESKEGDHVVDMAVADDTAELLSISALGFGTRVPVVEYPVKGRGGQGVINMRMEDERQSEVVLVSTVREGDDLILISERGKTIRMSASDVRLIGRGGAGVRVMKPSEGDRVASGVVLAARVEEGEGDRPVPTGIAPGEPEGDKPSGAPIDSDS